MNQAFLFLLFSLIVSVGHSAEKTISFQSGNLTLNGSLVTPEIKKKSQFPCVLLLPGSGPTDRDGNQPGLQSDLLKQLAQFLATKGVVSLRFDKRAVRSYQTFWPTDLSKFDEYFSWTNFKNDIHAAFLELKKTEGIQSKGCSILGHSEGGVFALDVAAELKPVSLILMGTPGRPLNQVLTEQIGALLDKQNAPPDQKKFYLSELSRIMSEIQKSGIVPKDIPVGLKALFPVGSGQFLQTDLALDPSKEVKTFAGPILILNGSDDKQVNSARDAEPLFEQAQKRPQGKTKMKLFKGLGHEFNSSTNSPISHEVLETLREWF